MRLRIRAEDGSRIQGKFIRNATALDSMWDSLTFTEEDVRCSRSCKARDKKFFWELKEFNSKNFKLQLTFLDKKNISLVDWDLL